VAVLGWNEKTQKGTFINSFTDETTSATDTTAFLGQARPPSSRSPAPTASARRLQ